MISPQRLYEFLKDKSIVFFTGVPDSLLKPFLKYIQDQAQSNGHVITANEGLAVALASGYHFSTGKIPLVYLQNSGLGNIINPITSLADKEMYSIPMLLMIGWRGRPGVADEPQHQKIGRITCSLLDALEIPYYLMNPDEADCFEKVSAAINDAALQQRPVALLVPEEMFGEYKGVAETETYLLQRFDVIQKIIAALDGDETIICTTGRIGREFYELNNVAGKKIKKYLLNVGAMGHANHIALGMQAESTRIVLDGDGALLMHLGALPTIAHHATGPFIHVVINNGSHESVGGQPTEGFMADLCDIARASGYRQATCITNETELQQWLMSGLSFEGVQFVEVRTAKMSSFQAGRPAGKPTDWKNDIMSALFVRNSL